MKTTLRNVKLFILDEVSMVSSLNLVYMHMRLDKLFGGTKWFGGKNMLFFGDLLQLEPVNGTTIFESVRQKQIVHKLGSVASVNIWRYCVQYDELTINQRQKSEPQFSAMLNDIRVGNITDEAVQTLEQRVVSKPVFELYTELSSKKPPICMFPVRQACNEFNDKVIDSVTCEVHEIKCTDSIDATESKRKWTDSGAKRLEKLNEDCNNTGGLLAKLVLAEGVHVMLCRNIDTKMGLVNGAIGTVLNIKPTQIVVLFDHMTEPYNVDRVTSKFMIMKSFYVCRSQFPLIPAASAVTIHKSQGLSLDNTIVDLSDRVFGAGMAYVALSRVRSLSGLHLANFDPKCVIVSRRCLEEINRLRKIYRPDLPLYPVPNPPPTSRNKNCIISASTAVASNL